MHVLLKSALTLSLTLGLTSCAFSGAGLPSGQISPTLQSASQKGFFSSALIKRPLFLRQENGQNVPVAYLPSGQESDFSVKQMAMTKPAIAPGYYYGGHDFNQYAIQFAEENIYPSAKGNSLLEVYNQSILPLLKEWDSSARLIESRAQINAQEPEYIQLPGRSGEPMKVLPNYVFRFASSPLKQTLNIYVLSNEIRVHRMVWGEAQIEINRVKIDSDQALDIARKAFVNRQSKPGYPVYPAAEELQRPGMEVIYELPEKLTWQMHLNQQEGKKLRYFLNFYWNRSGSVVAIPGQPVPMPVPMPAIATDMKVSQVSASSGGAAPDIAIAPISARAPYMPEQITLSGSIEIDAESGAILSLNRPVNYQVYPGAVSGGSSEASVGSAGVAVATPAIAPAPVKQ
ncbi:MAG: hypothetical protein AB7I41_03560 [Candidatus Sericytochromatia bacterium]